MTVPTLAFHDGRQTQLRHDMVDDRPLSGCEPESDCAAGTLPYSKTAAAQSAVWMKIRTRTEGRATKFPKTYRPRCSRFLCN